MPARPKKMLAGDDWQEIKRLFDATVDLSPEDRKKLIAESTQDRPHIRQEVETLLNAYDRDGDGETNAKGKGLGLHSSESDQIPQELGRYEILSLLGKGGMARVFLGRLFGAAGFSREFALKCILPAYRENAEILGLFEQEAQLNAQLQHPNIAQVYQFEKAGEDYFLSMEFIRGKDLEQILKDLRGRNARIPLNLAIHIICEICGALDYAHSKKDPRKGTALGIVHRDVAPKNIMISYEGVIKLLDFGIAKTRNQAGFDADHAIPGTKGYIAPEVFEGKPFDQRTDLYSLSRVLQDLLSTGTQAAQPLLDQDQETNFVQSADSIAKIQRQLQRIVKKGTSLDPDKRFQRAAELQLELAKLMGKHSQIPLRQQLASLMEVLFPPESEADARSESWPPLRLVKTVEPEQRERFSLTKAIAQLFRRKEVKPSKPRVREPKPLGSVAARTVKRTAILSALLAVCIALVFFAQQNEMERPNVISGPKITPSMRLKLGKKIGKCSIALHSQPEGATIWVNQKFMAGETPSTLFIPCHRTILLELEKGEFKAPLQFAKSDDMIVLMIPLAQGAEHASGWTSSIGWRYRLVLTNLLERLEGLLQ